MGAIIALLPLCLVLFLQLEILISHERIRSFVRLMLAAMLYFTAYAVFLLFTKDTIFMESYKIVMLKIRRGGRKNI